MINPVGNPPDMENGEEQIPHMDLNDEAKHLLFYLRLEDSIKDTLATVGEVLSLGRPGRRHRPKTASTSPGRKDLTSPRQSLAARNRPLRPDPMPTRPSGQVLTADPVVLFRRKRKNAVPKQPLLPMHVSGQQWSSSQAEFFDLKCACLIPT